MAEDIPLAIDGQAVRMIQPDGSTVSPRVPLNPIVIDSANQWVYYGAISGKSVYRARALVMAHFDDERIATTIQRVGEKPISDGIGIDAAGNIYSGDLPSNGIGVTRPDGTYELLFTDPILSWVDGFAAHPDGSMIAVANQLHRHAALNAGEDATKPPYLLIKFKPLAPSVVGK
jgi:sugar lactone lactonase YvrE